MSNSPRIANCSQVRVVRRLIHTNEVVQVTVDAGWLYRVFHDFRA